MNLSRILFTGIIFLTLAVMAGGLWWLRTQIQPVSSVEEDLYITIEEGYSAGRVARVLEDEGVVRNGTVFYLYARFSGSSSSLQAGFYRLSPNQTMAEILDVLTTGEVEHKVVQILSGFDLLQIEEALVEAGFERSSVQAALQAEYDVDVLRHKPASATLEGYIFPDTYHIGANATAADLIEMSLVNLQRHLTPELVTAWQENNLSIHEGLTLASIVQKEVSDPKEQTTVAQVFLLRLSDGQRLEADPTFMYAARQLNVPASIRVDSLYNTYRHSGLPPGPISNMEASAMTAVAEPATTNYRYFVTGKDGVTRFSETLNQHEAYIEEFGISGT